MVQDNRPQWLKVTQPFISGGVCGALATCVIQPIDMVKVRIQIAGNDGPKNPLTVFRSVVANEGVSALYKGLDAGVMRQLTYTTTRMGVFKMTSEALKENGQPLPFYKKSLASLLAGAVGAFVGNPCDLALIRMQADATLPVEQRRNYNGVFHAVRTIVKDEGVTALWKGSMPTIVRAMSLNLGMLATFEQGKEYFSEFYGSPGWSATLTASAFSGFGASFMSLPFDFVKTRMQKMTVDPVTGVAPYKNPLDCALKVLRSEGPFAFYAGFPTYYTRIAPHAMLVLILTDRANAFSIGLFANKAQD